MRGFMPAMLVQDYGSNAATNVSVDDDDVDAGSELGFSPKLSCLAI